MTRIFVYGSLLSGLGNHGLLRAARFLGEARTLPEYRMHSFFGFPGVTSGGADAILGEVYEVDAATLATLDLLERHPRWYLRTPITLDDGQHVETYLLSAADVEGRPLVAGGDWRAHLTDTRNT